MKSKYLVFVGMGFELVGLILGSAYLGHLLDQNYDLKGLGVVGLSVLGLGGWLTHVILLSKRLEKEDEKPT